jgi:hypothetical protein
LTRLLIGIPARNEADSIVALAERLEWGAAALGTSCDTRLALAYQSSDDDTLDRFVARPSVVPQLVLESPDGVAGKGANVKLLLRRALEDGDDYLLLVDADLTNYDPCNVARAVAFAERNADQLVLPLWPRPQMQANTTNYFACPLTFATCGARIRQPIAGHMLLGRALLERLDIDALPDDFGVDVVMTLTALRDHARVGQVELVAPDHPSKTGNSERVMVQVATALLRALASMPGIDRRDVTWPDRYWQRWSWPRNAGIAPDYVDVILQRSASEPDLARWLAFGEAGDDAVAEMWCDNLADAVRRARSPHPDLARIVDDLVCPFFVHAEHRARRVGSVAELEAYVSDLALRLAARLHA